MIKLIVFALSLISFPAQAALVGDDILRLVAADFGRANHSLAHTRISALLKVLKMPNDEVEVFPDIRSSKLVKSTEYYETTECDNQLLIVQSGIKISYADNCIVIADGAVEIAFANRVIVVSRDSINVSHDAPRPRDASGVYVTKGELAISHGRAPYIYALRGAKTSAPGMTTFNTDVRSGSIILPKATHNTIAPIFQGEPLRKSIGTSMRIDAGEYISYSGKRCAAAKPDVLLFANLLPYVRKHSGCPTLKSANVTCEQGEDVSEREFAERWTFDACGKPINVRFRGQRFTPDSSGASGAVAESMWID